MQVLVATMNQTDHSILETMNIQTDAIIANQCDKNDINEFEYNGHKIKYLSFAERGVGLNRNNALMRAAAEICIIADDDIVFEDGYDKKIKKYFDENPDVDVCIFNLREYPVKRYVIKKEFKVGFKNFMRFGATRIAFRRKSIIKHGISFNLLFGGGAMYSAGEDTLFLHDCLKAKLKIVAIPEYIATLTENRESTWFTGYTEKFFLDRGALFCKISKRMVKVLCLQFCLRNRKMFENDRTVREAYKLMLKGAKDFYSS